MSLAPVPFTPPPVTTRAARTGLPRYAAVPAITSNFVWSQSPALSAAPVRSFSSFGDKLGASNSWVEDKSHMAKPVYEDTGVRTSPYAPMKDDPILNSMSKEELHNFVQVMSGNDLPKELREELKQLVLTVKNKNKGVQTEMNKEISPEEQINKLHSKARDGCLDSINEIGDCYRKGRLGLPKDLAMAVQYYKRAAMANHAPAQYNLGLCYYTGTGVEQDDELCSKLLHEAGYNGHDKALAHLSEHYIKGEAGVKKNISIGLTLLKKAARTYKGAQYNLACLYLDGVADENGKVLLPQSVKKAMDFFKRGAEKGEMLSARLYAYYSQGKKGRHKGLEIDVMVAIEYYSKAAMLGDTVSMYMLAHIYMKGVKGKVPPMQEVAVGWLTEAAIRQMPEAQTTLREMGLSDHSDKGATPQILGKDSALARVRKDSFEEQERRMDELKSDFT